MNDGGPFFPCELTFHDTVDVLIEDRNATAFGQLVKQTKARKEQVSGISLRDWFAGMALQGILANPKTDTETEAEYPRRDWVHRAYDLADKMLYEHMNKK